MPPYNSTQITLALPGFHGLVKRLVLANVIVFLAVTVLGFISKSYVALIFDWFALSPYEVVHHYAVWQLVTNGFLQSGFLSLLLNMLALWFAGAGLESEFGAQWLGECYFISIIGSSLITVAASYLPILRLDPFSISYGCWAAAMGLIVAYGVFHADVPVYLFFVLRMKMKYIVALFIAYDIVGLLITGARTTAFEAHLGGAFSGYLYAKLAPRRGFGLNLSESWYGIRNAWYRRKRQKAARKFEVYISKQSKSAPVIDHDSKRDPNDRRWMN